MELFNPKNLTFDFVKHFGLARAISLGLTILGLGSMIWPGLNYGIDFRGGIETHVVFKDQKISVGDVRSSIGSKLDGVTVVNFKDAGKNEFLLTAQSDSKEATSSAVKQSIGAKYGAEGPDTWQVTQVDLVGRKVGADFKKSAVLSLIYTCLLVTLYLYWRFDIRFVPGALACIFHDLSIVTLVLVLCRAEFDTTIVAALLTLSGYSINDTVVVFDRIRETEHKYIGKAKSFIVNDAINSTLSRTIMTAGTTLVAAVVLFLLGGSTLRWFSVALFVGVIVGTYSSAFVAAPLYIWADKYFAKKAQTATATSPKRA